VSDLAGRHGIEQDLSRALTEAAARAICDVAKVELQLSDTDPLAAGKPDHWQGEAQAAVLTVLDTLAEWGQAVDPEVQVPPQIRIAVPAFQRLAKEIREGKRDG